MEGCQSGSVPSNEKMLSTRGNSEQLKLKNIELVQQYDMHNISATLQRADNLVLIRTGELDNEEPMKFPGIWLRDNCLCEECFHMNSESRKPHRWTKFDTKVRVRQLSVDAARHEIHIDWTDDHSSIFKLRWLQERDFSVAQRKRYLSEWYRPEAVLWRKADFGAILRKFDYNKVLVNDTLLADWLQSLAVYGVAMLKNAPLDVHVIQTLCNRIGFIRKTTYGEDYSIKSRPGAKNYSYTDMPYYEYLPGVTILHTLEQSQSQGGWNLLSDAFGVAEQLRTEHPVHFKVLTETPVDWADIGMEADIAFHNIWRQPVINLDADGKCTRINHSVPQRDSHFSVPLEQVVPWYEANACFVQKAQEQAVSFKMVPGDVLSLNNLRLLHGRTGYDDTDHNVRHLVGGFVDWDIVYSKMRMLKQQPKVQLQ